jgi:hypothetical protein
MTDTLKKYARGDAEIMDGSEGGCSPENLK